MHRFFVSREMIRGNDISILGEDVVHISKVLRLRTGDRITVSDGEDYEYLCQISCIDKKTVICDIIEKSRFLTEAPVKVHLYQGIPKAAKMDLIVQKCTELGIDTIIPVDTERVVIKLGNDRDTGNKIIRWRRIAEEASKQSSRGRIPSILEPIGYGEAAGSIRDYDLAIIPYEKENKTSLKQILKGKNNINKIAIFIGPEGGFSEDEVDMAEREGAFPVTLGPRILRTETAGFACLSILMYELGDMGGEYGKGSV